MDYGKTRELFIRVPGAIKTKNTGKIVKVAGFNKIIQPKESLAYADFIKYTFRQLHKEHEMTSAAVKIDFKAFLRQLKQLSNRNVNLH